MGIFGELPPVCFQKVLLNQCSKSENGTINLECKPKPTPSNVIMKFLAFAFAIALCACSSSTPGPPNSAPTSELSRPKPPAGKLPLIVEQNGQERLPLIGSVFWDGTTRKSAPVAYTGKTQFAFTVSLERLAQEEIGIFAHYANGRARIPYDVPETCTTMGPPDNSCYVQIGLFSFDKNDMPNVVIAISDGGGIERINVVRYHPPGSVSDVTRDANWELIGSFNGQFEAIVADKALKLPFGSQGLSLVYAFVNNKFVDATDHTSELDGTAPDWMLSNPQHATSSVTIHPAIPVTPAQAVRPIRGSGTDTRSENPQCSQLLGMLDTASSNARRVIMQNLYARGCSIPQQAIQHIAHPAYDQCVAVLQQAGASNTSRCDHLYNR